MKKYNLINIINKRYPNRLDSRRSLIYEQIASHLGVSVQHVRRYNWIKYGNKRTLNSDQLIIIAKVLNVQVSELINLEQSNN